METIQQELIEKALALTGKTMEDIKESYDCGFGYDGPDIRTGLSIEKFCYYLLSPEFIKEYEKITKQKYWEITIFDIGEAINFYQKWDSRLLKNLLYKI